MKETDINKWTTLMIEKIRNLHEYCKKPWALCVLAGFEDLCGSFV